MSVTFTGNEGSRDTSGKLVYGLVAKTIIRQSNMTVGTSRERIPATPLTNRISLLIVNNSSNILYIGDATVSTANGVPLFPRQGFRVEIEDNIDIYGVADAANTDIRLFEGA